ncbi:hypothetical protein ANANG_G00017250 [Anguilla anguilla]|uniref:DUF4455 domain-containing protein n=1 Tax=Anguilla anguilla TaxID=7936 RepID=A0A9D3MYN9_ANGAN|nr:hypothetical protein ANANG_G00017250 [Anguilla anguilla]
MMAETRVIPSGKVYRQMFDAQVQLSRTLHDTRRRRAANEVSVQSDNAPTARDTDTVQRIRDQLSSGARPLQESEEENVEEEVRGLPDTVVVEKLGSDIIERLAERKERSHEEMIAQLHQDLAALSFECESFLRKTADELLCRLLESIENADRLMQRMNSDSELNMLTFQDLQELWDSVQQGSKMRRKQIRDLDAELTQRESERMAMIAVILKTCTSSLETVGHMAAYDVHRLIDSEAMMINQASLANRRALARLCLNLTEKDLQGTLSHRQRWEDRLQDWKIIKVRAAVNRFRDFMSSPQIQTPREVQTTLDTLQMEQKMLSQRRVEILQSLSSMVPPKCSKALAAEWYSSLSSVNEQIDSLHIHLMIKLRLYYEQTYQGCFEEVDRFKEEVVGYGLPPEEIQSIVSSELLPVIGQCQSQSEERLEAMDRAFESLAKRVGALSKALFRFAQGSMHMWEVHIARLQRQEQKLQEQMEELAHTHELRNQTKEAELDMMLDRLRQESSENTLRISLDKALHLLEEIKNGYITSHKEEVDTVEKYPASVLKEMQTYSKAVSGYFKVKEIYCQGAENLFSQFPFIDLDILRNVLEERRGQCHGVEDLTGSSSELLIAEDNTDSPEELYDSPNETFTTSRGNLYNAQSFRVQWEADGEQVLNLSEVQLVAFPERLLVELQRDVRVAYFIHLEDWYQMALFNALNIVAAKREELKSGLDLRLQLQQSRAKRIEVDIHNVRAEELILHRDHVDRYCKGVHDTLCEIRTCAQDLQLRQQEQTEDFRTQIHAMKDVFTSATKSDKLAGLCSSLQSHLEKHMTVVQKSQRSFRQEAELTLGTLREANAQFIKSLQLFSDGGNYTPEEIEVFQKRLEKLAKCIDSTDEAITLDMEGTESRCLEQAKEIIGMFEEKFQFLTVDLKFLEKIQRILTNTQVQIKTEVTKSNMQKKNLDDMLMQLESMMKACARPDSEEKVAVDDVNTLACSIMEELKKRCQYLECSLDPSVSVPRPDSPLQGAFAVAVRPKSRRQDKPSSPATDSLLQPSRMGVPITDDAAMGVVRGLLRISKQKASEDVHTESSDRGLALTRDRLAAMSAGHRQRGGGTPVAPLLERQLRRSAESVSSQSVQRLSKLSCSDKRFQVFGTSPDEKCIMGFNGLITNILWKANDLLLSVAEEFYKKKDRRPVTRPQHLQETFEQCAEEINKRLLIYQSQTREYHNGCLQDFKEQLSRSEEHLSQVPMLLLSHLGEQHLEQLSQDTVQIYHSLELVQCGSENRKREHSKQLCVRLGHPAHEEELKSLCVVEENRQVEQDNTIHRFKLELQACVRKHGEEFVAMVASATEKLLFQMDNLLTVDEVQAGQTKKETLAMLIRQKESGVLLKEKEPQIQRGIRTWPGVCYFETEGDETVGNTCRKTASVTTVKTTLGHLATHEARDVVYQRYRQRYEEELARAEEESGTQMKQAERWKQHWKHSVETLIKLYSL